MQLNRNSRISEELTASIFTVEDSKFCLLFAGYLAYTSTLNCAGGMFP
jgi:hypothetical protein